MTQPDSHLVLHCSSVNELVSSPLHRVGPVFHLSPGQVEKGKSAPAEPLKKTVRAARFGK